MKSKHFTIGIASLAVVATLLGLILWRGQLRPNPPGNRMPSPPGASSTPAPVSAPIEHVPANTSTQHGQPSLSEIPKAATPVSSSIPRAPLTLPDDVSKRVRLIAGQAEEKDYEVRVTAVHALDNHLPPADVEGLKVFLKSRLENHPELGALALNAIKNDALEVLIAQETLPPDLLAMMLEMYRDPATDVIWRDYCLQHIALYYERRWLPGDETRLADPDRTAALSLYEEALVSNGDGFAGTALLGLTRLSRQYPEIDRTKVAESSLAFALNDQKDVATRITAVGLCGLLGKTEVLPLARILAQTGENTPLRLASVGTIGLIGTAEDIELMESVAAGSDNALQSAARIAVKRLKQRNVQ